MLKKKMSLSVLLLGLLCCSGLRAQEATAGAQVIPVNFTHTTNYFSAMSDNGLWIAAAGTEEENTLTSAYPSLVNATTGEVTELWEGGNYSGYTANDVTDDGKAVVGSSPDGAAYYDVDAKAWVKLPMADTGVSGEAWCVTPDGKRIAGYGFRGNFGADDYAEMALLWERQDDGTYRQIDVAEELEGFPIRDKNDALTGMVRIENMSADGNLLAGAMNFVYPQQVCYYIYDCTTHETVYIDNYMEEYGCQAGSFIDQSNMSNDGAYITGSAYVVIGAEEYTSAYRYNIKEKAFELYNTYNDEMDRAGKAIANDGTLFACSPAVNPLRYAYVRVGNLWFGLDEIMSERYNLNIAERLNSETTGTVTDVSDDGRVIAGMSMSTGSGYIVRLPETFAEAAANIDPLAAYAVSPAEGSAFARFRSATIAFTKPAKLVSGRQAQLLDESGKSVRSLTISANADGLSFNAGGMPTTLEAGKEYTLYFPAGTFCLAADESFTNHDIRIRYVGRENTPAQATNISPADGANVSEISTSNAVTITFDMNVQVATGEDNQAAVGYLYEADSESPLCELVITVVDNRIALAPALRRYLRNGIDYRVVLPAESVTDIMGDCGNEEITVTYHGIYVQEPSSNADLFFDDFNDPSVSMATYLLYEGDHNTPASVPAEWEFDADNHPWNFTLRESLEDTDYFAASHSMYNPAGKSDDWMALPQLIIENPDYYLTFDAQSYIFTKTDVLEVIVLEAEEGYTTFTKDLYDRFMAEGKTVFAEQLSPGGSQDGLYDDWTSYEVSLAEFSGKSIYIAFVNRNEDESVIFLDNVRVHYRGDFVLTNTTEASVVNQPSATVSAALLITGDDTYNDLTATCVSADGSFTSTYTATGLGLTSGSDAYRFEFPEELPLEVGEETRYTITVNMDGNQLSQSGVVRNLAFETTKRVVLEEGTGQGCGNCPRGMLAIENLQTLFGDRFIPIAIHSVSMGADPYAYDEYNNYVGTTGLPSGRINRIDTIYADAVQVWNEEANARRYSFNSEAGNETWLDIVQREFEQNPVADADVNITKADMLTGSKQVVLEGNVNYAVNMSSLNHTLVLVITENNLPGQQHNYFTSNDDPLLGEWGQGGDYGQPIVSCVYNHVARRVVDEAYRGLSGIIPVEVAAGEPVPFSITRTAYDNISNWGNCELVAMLVDANSGRVVNANIVPFTVDGVGIDEVAAESDIQVMAAGGAVQVACDEPMDVAVYSLNGQMAGAASGNGTVTVPVSGGKGLYIVRVNTANASVVRKVMLR